MDNRLFLQVLYGSLDSEDGENNDDKTSFDGRKEWSSHNTIGKMTERVR